MQALRSKINREKIDFFSNSELVHFESSQDQKIYFSFKNQTINLISKKLAICNNAFATQLYPDIDITPGRGMVVATKPIENLKLKGTFHYDQGYYYFRNFNQRILFGGGRNLDLKKEATHEFGINEKIKAQLLEDLQSFILLDQEVEIDTEWSGIMAFGKNKMPIIEKRGDQIALGIRLGGMGVAIGSRVGKAVAELLIK
jgi:glycine/D-amino acid oxidase-like deaminating enzyme